MNERCRPRVCLTVAQLLDAAVIVSVVNVKRVNFKTRYGTSAVFISHVVAYVWSAIRVIHGKPLPSVIEGQANVQA